MVRAQGRSRRSAALRHSGPLSGRPVTSALGDTGHHRMGSRRLRQITYNDQIRRLWKEIDDDWLAHERMLDEDLHDGLS